mgnify:CR=1 FL=1
MKITGPFRDPQKKKNGYPKTWYLRVKLPRTNEQGAPDLDAKGRPRFRRERPYYHTREAAEADIPRLRAQHGVGGVGKGGMLTRAQVEDYERARAEAPEATMHELAKFWRLHHPRQKAAKIRELAPKFLEWVKSRLGEERHYSDLKSRIGPVSDRSTGQPRDTPFLAKFGDRLPVTVTREEFLEWLLGLGKEGRTILNQKRAVINFFNWLATEAKVLETNQLAGIKKRQLPKALAKEIEFLSLPDADRYLRTLEHYDPEIIAHEVIQLMAGVRADDEMADFDGKWVLPSTREIVIPANVAKMERREVINSLEPNFWEWWKAYGRDGILRVPYYEQRWKRIRVLMTVHDLGRADELARLPIKSLLARPEAKAALQTWPWNARRRTFCTYKVAKDQSAGPAALILRHKGEAETLHNSYRGLGVTQEQGVTYFSWLPNPVSRPIYPTRPARGIIKLQLEKRTASATAPAAVA